MHFFRLWATCSGSSVLQRENSYFQSVRSDSLSSSTAATTGARWGMNRATVAALFSFSPYICLFTFFPLHPSHVLYCFKHGRVNLLILQAASLSIYLSSSLFFCSPSAWLRQGCAVRPFHSRAVVRSDGWLSTFCCLPLRSWEIYRLADYQAWKPISLSHSSLPPYLHPCLAPSIPLPLFQHLLHYQKLAFKMERCVQNNTEICVWTGWSYCFTSGFCGWVRGEEHPQIDVPGLWQPILHIFILSIALGSLKRLATHEHPSMFLAPAAIKVSEKCAVLIVVSKL